MARGYVGEIRMFAGDRAPHGWAICDGRILSASAYPELFRLIKATYGGDGEHTFALPDLRGRAPIHQGQGPGLQPCHLGERGGAETVVLGSYEIPTHRHHPLCSSDTAESGSPGGRVWGHSVDGVYADPAAADGLMDGGIGPAGTNQPHENMPPYLVINYVIALEGASPSPD